MRDKSSLLHAWQRQTTNTELLLTALKSCLHLAGAGLTGAEKEVPLAPVETALPLMADMVVEVVEVVRSFSRFSLNGRSLVDGYDVVGFAEVLLVRDCLGESEWKPEGSLNRRSRLLWASVHL